VVAPSAPKMESGLYWGYATRLAANLSAVFTQCPYVGGYDVIIGTSEHGNSVDDFVQQKFKYAHLYSSCIPSVVAVATDHQTVKQSYLVTAVSVHFLSFTSAVLCCQQ